MQVTEDESRIDSKALYDVYKKDFLMFEYNPEPFFKVSRKNQQSISAKILRQEKLSYSSKLIVQCL